MLSQSNSPTSNPNSSIPNNSDHVSDTLQETIPTTTTPFQAFSHDQSDCYDQLIFLPCHTAPSDVLFPLHENDSLPSDQDISSLLKTAFSATEVATTHQEDLHSLVGADGVFCMSEFCSELTSKALTPSRQDSLDPLDCTGLLTNSGGLITPPLGFPTASTIYPPLLDGSQYMMNQQNSQCPPSQLRNLLSTPFIKHEFNSTGGKYACQVCCRVFSMRCRLVAHARRHTGERPFHCNECGRAFFDRGNLQRHRYTHSNQMRFHCTVCGKYFRQASCLSNHRRFHCPGANGRPCLFCQRSFRSSSSLQMHIRWKHRNDATAAVIAAQKHLANLTSSPIDQSRNAKPPEGLRVHFNHEVSTPECTVGSSISEDSQSNQMMQSSSSPALTDEEKRRKRRRKKRPIQVPVGSLLSTLDVSKTESLMKESDVEAVPNRCDDLNTVLPQLPDPIAQMVDASARTCTFVCPVCPRRFAFQCRLAAHLRTHMNIRPFVCPDCGRAFTQRDYLLRHTAVHRQERPFACAQCQRAYKHYGSLVNHRKTHSKN